MYCTLFSVMYTVQSTVHCSVYCPLFSVLYTVQCTVYCSVYCTLFSLLYTVQCTVYCSMYCILFSVLYSVQCTVHCSEYCTLFSVLFSTHNRILTTFCFKCFLIWNDPNYKIFFFSLKNWFKKNTVFEKDRSFSKEKIVLFFSRSFERF